METRQGDKTNRGQLGTVSGRDSELLDQLSNGQRVGVFPNGRKCQLDYVVQLIDSRCA